MGILRWQPHRVGASFVTEKLVYAFFFVAGWHGLVSSLWLARASFLWLARASFLVSHFSGFIFKKNWAIWSGWHVARVQLLVGSCVIYCLTPSFYSNFIEFLILSRIIA